MPVGFKIQANIKVSLGVIVIERAMVSALTTSLELSVKMNPSGRPCDIQRRFGLQTQLDPIEVPKVASLRLLRKAMSASSSSKRMKKSKSFMV